MIFVITLLLIYFICLVGLIIIIFKANKTHTSYLMSQVKLKVGKVLMIKNGKVYLNGKEENNSSKIGLKLLQYADSTVADTKIINSFDEL